MLMKLTILATAALALAAASAGAAPLGRSPSSVLASIRGAISPRCGQARTATSRSG
jgi:hypothetical protein